MKALFKLGCVAALGFSIAGVAHAGAASAPVDYFSGGFVGANLGYEAVDDNFRTTDGDKINGGNGRFALGAFAGYGHVLAQSFYLGGNVFYRTTLGRSTLGTLHDDDDNSNGTISVSARNTFGVQFTPGYLFTPRVLVHAILGAENTSFQLRTVDTADGTTTKSSRRWGFFPGVGVEFAVTPAFHIGGNYTYHWYNGFSATTEDTTGKVSPRRSLFMLTGSYHFKV